MDTTNDDTDSFEDEDSVETEIAHPTSTHEKKLGRSSWWNGVMDTTNDDTDSFEDEDSVEMYVGNEIIFNKIRFFGMFAVGSVCAFYAGHIAGRKFNARQ